MKEYHAGEGATLFSIVTPVYAEGERMSNETQMYNHGRRKST